MMQNTALSMPVKKRKLITALEQKGFRKKETPHHTYYSFTDNEEKICRRVRTRISHGGGKDIDDNLLAQMAKQMQLDSRPVLEEFIECTITEESYREILRKKRKGA